MQKFFGKTLVTFMAVSIAMAFSPVTAFADEITAPEEPASIEEAVTIDQPASIDIQEAADQEAANQDAAPEDELLDVEEVNFENLVTALNQAKKTRKHVEVSDDGTDVYQSVMWTDEDARYALQGAVRAAQKMLASAATQDEVDAAVLELEMAIDEFNSAKREGLMPLVSIASASVQGVKNVTYNGQARTQAMTVTLDNHLLAENVDYTITYSNNVNAGTATYQISGTGIYTGQVTGSFTIAKVSVGKATVAGMASKTYNGKAQAQNLTVKVDGRTLVKGTDYTLSYKKNTAAGTASVTIAGKGNYSGSTTKQFKINKLNIAKTNVAVIPNKTYTGGAQYPKPAVKIGDSTLKNGTDYTLAYKANKNAGTATIAITGKGSCTGTKKTTFKITRASVAKAAVSGIGNRTYNGKAQTQKPTVKVGGRTLKNGTDYTLSYKANKNVGTATVTITGKGNYTGTKKVSFKIYKPANYGGGTVYTTATGIRYHRTPNCYGLRNARAIYTNTRNEARAMGLTPCHVCKPA